MSGEAFVDCLNWHLEAPNMKLLCSCLVASNLGKAWHLIYSRLLTDNLQWWFDNRFFAKSAEAITKKMGFPDNRFGCNCLRTCTPGGGPAEAGTLAARFDAAI